MKVGLDKFLGCLDFYLELLQNPTIDESLVKIYGSVILENGAIMRATNKYHNRAWFSGVAISLDSEESNDYTSDQGICYGQVS
jgi:hypothetical protein